MNLAFLNVIPLILLLIAAFFVFVKKGSSKERYQVFSLQKRMKLLFIVLLIYIIIMTIIYIINSQLALNESYNVLSLLGIITTFYLLKTIQRNSGGRISTSNTLYIFLVISAVVSFVVIIWAIFVFNYQLG